MKKLGYSIMLCFGLLFSLVIFSEKNYADMAEDVGVVKLIQPSGEVFNARIQGDEWLHYAVVESSNEVLMRDTEGTWFYTLIDASSNELIVSTNKYLIDKKPNNAVMEKDLDKIHVENLNNKSADKKNRSYEELIRANGPNRTLVVMIEYNNFSLKNSKQDWYNKVFKKGPLSVNDYYDEATKGKITLSPIDNTQEDNVPGVIKIKLNKNHPNSGFDSDIGTKTREDIKLALDQIKNYIDFNQLDTDGSNFITPDELHTLFVFSGYSASAGASDRRITPTIWPHRSGGNYLLVSNKVITTYTVVSDLRKARLEDQDNMMSIGTIVHEFGHDFGLPDLYNPSGAKGAGLGSYSVMANSHTTMNGKVGGTYPVHFDAYSKVKLGIVVPKVVKENQTININDIFNQNTNVVKIETKDPKQYYLLENRQFKGFDEALKTYIKNPGVGIYYVNENIQKNQGAGQQIVTLKEADEGIVGYSKLDAKVYDGYDGFYYNLGNHPTLLDGTTTPSNRLPDKSYLEYAVNVIDSPKESMMVTFSNPTIPVDSISLNQDDFGMKIGEEKTLIATVNPENATSREVEWISSDASVASVDIKGNIVAHRTGKVTITSKVKGTDKIASTNINVTGYEIDFSGNYLNSEVRVNTIAVVNKNYNVYTIQKDNTINVEFAGTSNQLGLTGKSVKINKVYSSTKGNDYYLLQSTDKEYIINSAAFFLMGDTESNSVVEIDSINNFLNTKDEFVERLIVNKNYNVYTIDEKLINSQGKSLAVCVSTTSEMGLVNKSVDVIAKYKSTLGSKYYRVDIEGKEYVINSSAFNK